MSVSSIGVGLVAALAMQTTLVPMLAGSGAPIDLVLVVVVVAAIAEGSRTGLWTGTVGGLLQDALSGGVLGMGGLAKTVVGYLAGQFAARFVMTSAWCKGLAFFGGSVLHTGLFAGGYSLFFDGWMVVPPRDLLTQAAANTVVGLVVARGMQPIPDAIDRQRLRERWPGGRYVDQD